MSYKEKDFLDSDDAILLFIYFRLSNLYFIIYNISEEFGSVEKRLASHFE